MPSSLPPLSNFLYVKSFKTINICYTLTILTLCTLSYLLGTSSPRASTPTLTKTSCITTTTTTTHALDFGTHHATDNLLTLMEARGARVTQIPPCHVSLSEYSPCEHVPRSLPFPRNRLIYRERHCPGPLELLKCLIPAPHGYRNPMRWSGSRDEVWYSNVPHRWLTVEKAGQNWVRFEGDRFRFPGGGTMFPDGAERYIDGIGEAVEIRGGRVRTVVDTGCGVCTCLFMAVRGVLVLVCLKGLLCVSGGLVR